MTNPQYVLSKNANKKKIHNYLTRNTNAEKSTQISDKKNKYRQIHTNIWQVKQIQTNPHNYLTKKTNTDKSTQLSDKKYKYRQIHKTI